MELGSVCEFTELTRVKVEQLLAWMPKLDLLELSYPGNRSEYLG